MLYVMNLIQKWLVGMVGLGVVSSSYASDQIIIKFAATPTQLQQARISPQAAVSLNRQLMQPLSAARLQQISQVVGMSLADRGPVAIGGRVIQAKHDLTVQEMTQVLAKLNAMPGVQYAVEDKLVNATGSYMPEPNVYQWDMRETSVVPGLTDEYFGDAFYLSSLPSLTGTGVTVAVVDTGYVPHPNFLAHLISLPNSGGTLYGYDFISDCRVAGSCPAATSDAMARRQPTADALDLGDYLTPNEYNQAAPSFKRRCTGADGKPSYSPKSTWHGTHVTGTIIAQGTTDPNSWSHGVLGGAIGAKVAPVRVIGKCGGLNSDVINGMMWAGGFPVLGAADNQNPAKIINLSLGGQSSCEADYQDAINQLNRRGVLIVVAAGNKTMDVSRSSPANCASVISVAAAGPINSLATYSNYGAVTITAAGGDTNVSPKGGVWSTIYNSTTGYGVNGNCDAGPACFGYASYQGTSMASPHVAAALADILESRPNLTYSQARNLLQASADPFYSCNLQNTGCVGSGRLNAQSLINYVVNNILVLKADPSALAFAGNQSSTASFINENSAAVTISKVEISGPNAANFEISSTSCEGDLVPGGSCAVTVTPVNLPATAAFAAALVVYNSANQVIAQVSLVRKNSTPASSSGGGGCSMIANGEDGSLTLILLEVAALIWLRRRKTS
jgi:serine protease